VELYWYEDSTPPCLKDPAAYLESLVRHHFVNINCRSRISKHMIERSKLHLYIMPIAKALKKCLHMSMEAILSELRQLWCVEINELLELNVSLEILYH
jgi:hypothetical protein